MKPMHLAVAAALLAAGLLLYLSFRSDDEGRAARSGRARDDTAAVTPGASPGSGTASAPAPAGDGPLSITLELLMPSGEAAAGANIELTGRARIGASAGNDGVLRLDGLHPGLYDLFASRGKAVGAKSFELKRVSDLGTLRLAAALTVRGHVYDGNGAPVPGAEVVAVTAKGGGKPADMMRKIMNMLEPDAIGARTVSGENGAYELTLPGKGDYAIRVSSLGYGQETTGRRMIAADIEGLDFHLFPAAHLTGKVIDTDGAPIVGAHVIALSMQSMLTGREAKVETATNAAGAFSLPYAQGVDFAQGVDAMLVVHATGYSTHMVDDAEWTPRGITITLERGIALRARALDEKQRPASGVDVLAVYRSSFATGKTGPDGRIEIENLSEEAGAMGDQRQLMFFGGVYVPMAMELPDKEPVDGVLDIGDVELSLGGIVRGTVLDAVTKQPVAGARVRAVQAGDMEMTMMSGGSAVSAGDGSYELKGVPLQNPALFAVHPDYTIMGMFEMMGEKQPPVFAEGSRMAQKDILLTPAVTITGTVVGPDGTGVPGAKVYANDEEMFFGAMLGILPEPPVSGEGGVFVFRGLSKEQELTLVAVHGDYGPSQPVQVKAGKTGVEIRLVQPVSLAGRVVDAEGRPVAGAGVSVDRRGEEDKSQMVMAGPEIAGSRPTVTDKQGRYVLRNAPLGDATITCHHPDYKLATKQLQIDGSQKTKRVPDITVETGLSISGVVLGEDGRPLADIGVRFSSGRKEANGRTSAHTVTGKDGRFKVSGLADGDFGVEASGRDWFETNTTARAGTSGLRIELRRPGRLAGRVTSGGQPVAGALVSATTKGGTSEAIALPEGVELTQEQLEQISARSFSQIDSAKTADDGSFELDRLPPDATFRLNVTHANHKKKEIKDLKASERSVHITLDAGVRIAGIVVGDDNRPIKGARVKVFVNGSQAKSVRTGTDGRFKAGGLEEGTLTVRVEESGLGLIASAPVEVRPGNLQVRLIARRGLTITGTVRDAGGKLMRQVSVSALGPDDKPLASDWVWAKSGKFTLKGLPPGSYRLKVESWEGELEPFVSEAVAAGTEGLEIRLP